MGVSWQVALGAVFLSGVLFLIVSLLRIREWLVNAIPMPLKLGIGAGIGLFLGLIGLHEMGLVIGNPETLVTLGHLATPATLLACLGFLIIAGLSARGTPAAITASSQRRHRWRRRFCSSISPARCHWASPPWF
jgi:AGZA family xanthine/uracil permease-like MFS transporter